ncbi:MAG: hypothetical protein NVSMB26_09480 [Beijerinckiaceae bacterium]
MPVLRLYARAFGTLVRQNGRFAALAHAQFMTGPGSAAQLSNAGPLAT